jgi:hypothetical protein
MFDYHLFLGLPLHLEFAKELQTIPISLRSSFIQDHPDYLQMIEHNGVTYLGKRIGTLLPLNSLELLEANIYSLLKCLVAHYTLKKDELRLIVIESPESK